MNVTFISSRQREEERQAGEGGRVPCDGGPGVRRDPSDLRESLRQMIKRSFTVVFVCPVTSVLIFKNYCKLAFLSWEKRLLVSLSTGGNSVFLFSCD